MNSLAEVLGRLGSATEGPWVVVTGKNISVGPCPGKRVALCNYDNGPIEKANAAAIVAAVNFLRSHGAAVAELVEAARDGLAVLATLNTELGLSDEELARSNRLHAALARMEPQA